MRQPAKFGRYEVERTIGRGAMGIVYLCNDPKIRRKVAIKTVHVGASDAADEEELRERLLREASAAGVLSHPNIVTIYDVGQEGETIYIVMEYLEGTPLSDAVAGGRSVGVQEMLAAADQVGCALDYAHGVGIIHRDVKPANIMRLADGRLKLMDFGIALGFEGSITRTGIVVGSPVYMSPEQVDGDEATGSSDIYSLAAVIFELLTGQRPFIGDSFAAIMRDKFENRRPALSALDSKLPPALEGFFDLALAVDPSRRFATGEELGRQLRAALYSRPNSMPVHGLVARSQPDGAPRSEAPEPTDYDPALSETVIMADDEVEAELRGSSAGVAAGPSNVASTQRRPGLSASHIRAYTSMSGGAAGAAAVERDDQTTTSFIRRAVEREIRGREALPREALPVAERARLETAIEATERRLRLSPRDARTIEKLGRLYQKLGQAQEAMVQLWRALKIDFELTGAYDAIGEIYNGLGMRERATVVWAISELVHFRRVGRLSVESHYRLGKLLEKERLLRAAIEVWEETVVLQPDHLDCWRDLAGYYMRMRDYPKAIEAHNRILQLQPGDAKVCRNLATALQNTKRYREALDAWRRSLRMESAGEGAERAHEQVQYLQLLLSARR